MYSKKVIPGLIVGVTILSIWVFSTLSSLQPEKSQTVTSTNNETVSDPFISSSTLVGLPTIEQVQTITMGSFGPYIPEDDRPLLIPSDSKDLIIINNILSWLKESSVIGINDVKRFPRHNLNFIIQLQDGTFIQIERAYTSISTSTPNGETVEYPTISDQVFVKFSNHPELIRLQSPQLATWINGSWQKDMKPIKQRS